MGEHDLRAPSSTANARVFDSYPVVSVVTHHGFTLGRLANNIAVVKVKRRIDNVTPACLPNCRGMFDFQFANGTGTK